MSAMSASPARFLYSRAPFPPISSYIIRHPFINVNLILQGLQIGGAAKHKAAGPRGNEVHHLRIRHKPYARPELAAWPRHINAPLAQKGHWRDVFESPEQPIYLELGCGKGSFLAKSALANPGVNYLGIDIKSEMLVVAKRNAERLFSAAARQPGNFALTAFDVEKIAALFDQNDPVHRIYINFCNPWCKAGHAKHRLTHPRQLAQYRGFLPDGAHIYFKTDNDPLFADSLRYFPYTGYDVIWENADLHAQEPDWNIRTEHEDMFSTKGIPIKACIAQKTQANLNLDEIARSKNL